MRTYILCGLFGIIWGIISSKLGLTMSDWEYWAVVLSGCTGINIMSWMDR